MKKKSPEDQLAGFLARYTHEIAEAARVARAKLQELLPGAVEMVYDNYNAVVIGFGPTDRPSEAILSLILYPRWLSLCFLHGATLRDPQKLLKGSGKQVRHIVLEGGEVLEEPSVQALIAQAVERAPEPFDESVSGRLIIRSISPTRRPRRPAN